MKYSFANEKTSIQTDGRVESINNKEAGSNNDGVESASEQTPLIHAGIDYI